MNIKEKESLNFWEQKINKFRKFVDEKLSDKRYLKKEIIQLKKEKRKIQGRLKNKQRAYLFIEQIAIKTQKQLEINLNQMVSSGLNSVFDDFYEFDVHFELKRDRPQCVLSFKKDNQLIDPLEFSGLGAADVAAFCLRAACLSMINYRKILILDEPFQRLKGQVENKRVIELMKKISMNLGIQIITVSDERATREDIIEGADKVFYIEQKNRLSQIYELK